MSQPVEILYFYRTRWGHHDEFVELFLRNHWPILREQQAAGRYTDVQLRTPRFHGVGEAGWDVLVSITYRDWAAVQEHSDGEIVQRLYPDQATFSGRGAAPLRAPRGALGRGAGGPAAPALRSARPPTIPQSCVVPAAEVCGFPRFCPEPAFVPLETGRLRNDQRAFGRSIQCRFSRAQRRAAASGGSSSSPSCWPSSRSGR